MTIILTIYHSFYFYLIAICLMFTRNADRLHTLYPKYINPIAFPSEVTIQVGEVLTNNWNSLSTRVINGELNVNDLLLPSTMQSTKYMDDATFHEALDLNDILNSMCHSIFLN